MGRVVGREARTGSKGLINLGGWTARSRHRPTWSTPVRFLLSAPTSFPTSREMNNSAFAAVVSYSKNPSPLNNVPKTKYSPHPTNSPTPSPSFPPQTNPPSQQRNPHRKNHPPSHPRQPHSPHLELTPPPRQFHCNCLNAFARSRPAKQWHRHFRDLSWSRPPRPTTQSPLPLNHHAGGLIQPAAFTQHGAQAFMDFGLEALKGDALAVDADVAFFLAAGLDAVAADFPIVHVRFVKEGAVFHGGETLHGGQA